VSTDLDQMFAAARADGDEVPLAGPADLRRIGDRRTRHRRVALAGGAAFAVAAVVAFGVAVAGSGPNTVNPPASSPTASAAPTPSVAGSPTPTGAGVIGAAPTAPSAPPTSPSRAAGAACRKGDLRVLPVGGDGATGHVGWHVNVSNKSGTMCTLSGVPRLVTSSGTTVPATPEGSATVKLQPGATANATYVIITAGMCSTVSNPPGFKPVDYKNLSIVLASGERMAVPGLELNVQCGGIEAHAWTDGQVTG
jgi:hypothetical protein